MRCPAPFGAGHLASQDDLEDKINEVKTAVKFQMKKVLCLNSAIANTDMSADEIETNAVSGGQCRILRSHA